MQNVILIAGSFFGSFECSRDKHNIISVHFFACSDFFFYKHLKMEAKDTRKQANPCSLMFITSYITYSWVFPEMLGCGGSQPEGGRYKLWSSSIETRQCLVLALETLDQPHSTMVQPSSQTRERLVCLYVRLVH